MDAFVYQSAPVRVVFGADLIARAWAGEPPLTVASSV